MLNLTPHNISILNPRTEKVENFPASGELARVGSVDHHVSTSNTPFDVVETLYGEVTGVPKAGTQPFLVSAMVLGQLGPEYHGWAYAPDTGPSAVRNEKGHISYVTQLRTVAAK